MSRVSLFDKEMIWKEVF